MWHATAPRAAAAACARAAPFARAPRRIVVVQQHAAVGVRSSSLLPPRPPLVARGASLARPQRARAAAAAAAAAAAHDDEPSSSSSRSRPALLFRGERDAPHKALRVALRWDASGRRLPAALLARHGVMRTLRRHPRLLQHPLPSGRELFFDDEDDDTPPEHAAAAQRRLLRLLGALEAACPALLLRSGDAAGGVTPQRCSCTMSGPGGGRRRAYLSRGALRARRLDTLARFAVLVPDGAWARAPEAWEPARGAAARARCVVGSKLHRCVHSVADSAFVARFFIPSSLQRLARAAARLPGLRGGHLALPAARGAAGRL
jgi:hypothetical protein